MISKKKILAFLLLLMIFDGCKAAISTHFKLLRGFGKNYESEDIQRSEDLEYPGKDARIRQILRGMWTNYYKCLEEKVKQESKPEIRRLLEGQFTEFKCDICERPFQNYEEIEWKYKPLSPEANITELDYLDLAPEMTLTPNKTLQIFNAIESFEGLYVCYQKKNVLSVYLLEVSKNDTIEKVNSIKNSNNLSKSQKNFYVKYLWTDFTDCSVCGRVGKKFKYGTCYVKRQPTIPLNKTKYVTVSLNVPGPLLKSNQFLLKIPYQVPVIKNFFTGDNSTSEADKQNFGPEIIDEFSNGIPCASPYLPKAASDFAKNYTSVKVIAKYCWEPCQKNEIFEVLDNYGNVIEMANNSAGVYSLFQKIPSIPPGIERRSIAAEFGSNIIIQCPGTLLTNTPYVWKVNKKVIHPDVVSNSSNGRFTVDLVNRIHIKKLRLKDGQIFSCWQRGKLVGTVHLNVEKKFKIGFNHHVTLIGIIAVIGTFLMVGSKILTRELKMRKK